MKYFLSLFLLFYLVNISTGQIIQIPDAKFKNALVNKNTVDTNNDNYGDKNADTNDDGEIDVDEALAITALILKNQQIQSLEGISSFTNLEVLRFSGNNLNHVDLSMLTNLRVISCSDSDINSLNIEGLVKLESLYCRTNDLTELKLDGLISLKTVLSDWNDITELVIKNLPKLEKVSCFYSKLTEVELSNLPMLKEVLIQANEIHTLDLNELPELEHLECDRNNIQPSLNLQSFTKLSYLDCSRNELISLDIRNLSSLDDVNCGINNLSELSLENSNNIRRLSLNQNSDINSLDVSQLAGLEYLNFSRCSLTDIDLTSNPLLKSLAYGWNNFSSLEIGPLENLEWLYGGADNVTEISTKGFPNLKYLQLNYSKLKSLDVSHNKKLGNLNITESPLLEFINIKNGKSVKLDLRDDHNLSYICCDKPWIPYYINEALDSDIFCEVNSYCSFEPGTGFNKIRGNIRLDLAGESCDAGDVPLTYRSVHLLDSELSGISVANRKGEYFFTVPQGSYMVQPQNNLSYFHFEPEESEVDFDSVGDSVIQDFCLVPDGIFYDLDIQIIPIIPARPGFNAEFKLFVRNKGTVTENADVELFFEQEFLNYISSIPNQTSQGANSLKWSIENLEPFETKEINVVFECHSPMDEPPLNIGDVLNYEANVKGSSLEETEEDNSIEYDQILVGSLDPNDKICLEGVSLDINKIGEFVRYIIRFENTGTYLAQNVVISDNIDISRFDLSTIEIIDASHDVTTALTENNMDFIFENIELPFEDGQNTGYVCFKIKALPNITVGTILKNQANIYFDFNYPVITNIFETEVVQVSSLEDLSFSTIEVFPNPASEILCFMTDLPLKNLILYDVQGNSTVKHFTDESCIDIRELPEGVYFFEVLLSNRKLNGRFIKN
jgi:uncharacterized repeat protein (TIGR01451 family)